MADRRSNDLVIERYPVADQMEAVNVCDNHASDDQAACSCVGPAEDRSA